MYQQPSLKHRITLVLYPQLCGMFVFVCSRSFGLLIFYEVGKILSYLGYEVTICLSEIFI